MSHVEYAYQSHRPRGNPLVTHVVRGDSTMCRRISGIKSLEGYTRTDKPDNPYSLCNNCMKELIKLQRRQRQEATCS